MHRRRSLNRNTNKPTTISLSRRIAGRSALAILMLGAIVASMLALRDHAEPLRAQESQASGQHASHVQTSEVTPRATLPIAVKGAETPELIPDHLAYRHFLMSASVHAKATEREVSRRQAVLRATGLADYDRRALGEALKGFREALDAVAAERRTLTRDSLQTTQGRALVAALKLRDQQIADDARRRVIAAVSPDGFNILDAYIQNRVKRKIVVFGDLPR